MNEHQHEYRFAFTCGFRAGEHEFWQRQHYTCQICLASKHQGKQRLNEVSRKPEVYPCGTNDV